MQPKPSLLTRISQLSLKNKILLGMSVLSIISLIYIASYTTPQTNNPPTATITATPFPNLQVPELVYVDPPPGDMESFWTTQAIQFKFNQPMDVYSIQYSIQPNISIKISPSDDETSVYIRPAEGWVFNQTYTIKINSLKSVGGQTILSPISHEFTIFQPQDVKTDF